MYYNLWRLEKIDRHTAWSLQRGTRLVHDDIPPCWIHDEVDIKRTPSDTSLDYDVYTYRIISPSSPPLVYEGQVPGQVPSSANCNSTNNYVSCGTLHQRWSLNICLTGKCSCFARFPRGCRCDWRQWGVVVSFLNARVITRSLKSLRKPFPSIVILIFRDRFRYHFILTVKLYGVAESSQCFYLLVNG